MKIVASVLAKKSGTYLGCSVPSLSYIWSYTFAGLNHFVASHSRMMGRAARCPSRTLQGIWVRANLPNSIYWMRLGPSTVSRKWRAAWPAVAVPVHGLSSVKPRLACASCSVTSSQK